MTERVTYPSVQKTSKANIKPMILWQNKSTNITSAIG
jgi:hypothetical protein